jgi:hypothetical protein
MTWNILELLQIPVRRISVEFSVQSGTKNRPFRGNKKFGPWVILIFQGHKKMRDNSISDCSSEKVSKFWFRPVCGWKRKAVSAIVRAKKFRNSGFVRFVGEKEKQHTLKKLPPFCLFLCKVSRNSAAFCPNNHILHILYRPLLSSAVEISARFGNTYCNL